MIANRIAFTCFFALSCPAILLCQISTATSASVKGDVFSSSDNSRRQGVLVDLCDPGRNPVTRTFTDESGGFEFRNVERGAYVLTFEAPGYQKAETQVDLSVVSEQNIIVNLKPNPPSQASAPTITVSSHELKMPEKARELRAAGEQKLYAEKNPRGSLDYFLRATDQAPDYYEAHYDLGLAFLALGESVKAETSFRKALEVSSGKFGDACIALGALLADQGKVPEAERTLRQGVSLSPNSWVGFFQLGKLEMGRGDIDGALKMAERARSLSPNSAVVYRLLANIHIQEKDSAALLADIDAYLKLDPDSAAGLRAKQLRQQVQEQLHNENPSTGPRF